MTVCCQIKQNIWKNETLLNFSVDDIQVLSFMNRSDFYLKLWHGVVDVVFTHHTLLSDFLCMLR